MPNLTKTAILAAAIGALTLSAGAQFQVIQSWDFNDPEGTLASEANVGVPGGPTFSSDLGSTATTGDGTLRIRRGVGGNSQSQAFLDTSEPQHLRIDLEIAGWNLVEGSPRFRVGFTNAEGTQQTTDFQLDRDGEDMLYRAVAFGTGADNISSEVSPWGNFREDPIFVRLEYDGINHEYNVQYDDGGGWELLYAGNTSPERNAGALRLYALNTFDGEGEYFDVANLTLTAIPEPSTYAAIFGGLALLGAFVWRRRRS